MTRETEIVCAWFVVGGLVAVLVTSRDGLGFWLDVLYGGGVGAGVGLVVLMWRCK